MINTLREGKARYLIIEVANENKKFSNKFSYELMGLHLRMFME